MFLRFQVDILNDIAVMKLRFNAGVWRSFFIHGIRPIRLRRYGKSYVAKCSWLHTFCQVSGLVPHLHQANPDDVQRLIAAAAAGFLGCFVGGVVFVRCYSEKIGIATATCFSWCHVCVSSLYIHASKKRRMVILLMLKCILTCFEDSKGLPGPPLAGTVKCDGCTVFVSW